MSLKLLQTILFTEKQSWERTGIQYNIRLEQTSTKYEVQIINFSRTVVQYDVMRFSGLCIHWYTMSACYTLNCLPCYKWKQDGIMCIKWWVKLILWDFESMLSPFHTHGHSTV